MTPAEKSTYFAEKDATFSAQVKSGDWPQDTCKICKRRHGGCCQSHHHHVGDCCNHCGNDERHGNAWLFRGKGKRA